MIQHGDIRIMSATSTYDLQGMTVEAEQIIYDVLVPLTVCLARKLDVDGCVASTGRST